MADLTLTASSVAPGANAVIDRRYNAGATITAGQVVYLDASNTWQLADANLSQAAAAASGIALHGASAGQPLAVQTGGSITLGSVLTVGVVYTLSATAGAIAPVSDGTTGWYVTVLGIAISASVLAMQVQVSGVAKP